MNWPTRALFAVTLLAAVGTGLHSRAQTQNSLRVLRVPVPMRWWTGGTTSGTNSSPWRRTFPKTSTILRCKRTEDFRIKRRARFRRGRQSYAWRFEIQRGGMEACGLLSRKQLGATGLAATSRSMKVQDWNSWLPHCRQPFVRPGKLLKMIVWRGGTRSDRASHRT